MKNPSTQTLFATLTLDACSMQILNDLHVPDAFIARVHTGTEKLQYVSLESREKASPGGYSLIWVMRVRAAGQSMLFWPRCPKQGIQLACLCPKQV